MSKKINLLNDVHRTLEVSIRLILFLLLIGGCFLILRPFITPFIWGVLLAVSVAPLYKWIKHRLNNRGKLAAVIMTILILAIFLVPTVLFFSSIINGFQNLGLNLSEETFQIPSPPEKVQDWPIVGMEIYKLWTAAHDNIAGVLSKYSNQLTLAGEWLLRAIKNVGISVVYLFISIIISGILLAAKGTDEITQQFYRKLVGDRGKELRTLTEATIRQVTKGILGVSFIQSLYLGIIFILAGIPHAGIWALLCFILAAVQIGPFLVVIPTIIFIFTYMSTGAAIFWGILLFLGTIIDNVLKPILLGKGAPVPMLVVFLGAIGGLLLSGFLGLFTGAILLSLAYNLFMAWLYDEETAMTRKIPTHKDAANPHQPIP